MNFIPVLLLGFLNTIKDPTKKPGKTTKTPLGPQTPGELAQAREALLGKGDDEIIDPNESEDARFARMTSGIGLWPGKPVLKEVPYVISHALQEHKNLILQAMEQFHENTCIRFVPRTYQHDYIKLVKGDGCSSYIGRIGGEQQVNLGDGCHYIGTIVHELGHAVGMHHEHKRPDRDNHVYINWHHIKEDKKHNFEIARNIPNHVLSTPYSYDSIMHYSSNAFAKQNHQHTIVAKNGHKLQDAYYKKGLTYGDILHIAKLYYCSISRSG